MNPSAALPLFPLDPRSGIGVRVTRQGTAFRFDAEDVPLRTTGAGPIFAVATPGGPVALRNGLTLSVQADRDFIGDALLAIDDNPPRPLLAANGLPLPRLIAGRVYRFSFDAVRAVFRADALATVQNDELAPAPAATLKGNPGTSAAVPTDLAADAVRRLLNLDKVTNTSDLEKTQSGPVKDAIQAVQDDLDAHTVSQANPHGTTAAQVGAYAKAEADATVAAARAAAIETVRGGVASTNDTLKKLADSISVAAQGIFPAATLAQLTANTTALQGTVDGDGANNGSYVRTVRNDPSTPWIRVSTATLPALDARLNPFEALIQVNPADYLDSGDLAVFLDGLQRIIGTIGADATWQILQDAVRLKDGPTMAAYDTLTGEHIAIVDAAGNQVPVGILLDKVRLPGGLTMEHYETLDPDAPGIAFVDAIGQILPVDLAGNGPPAVVAEVTTARGSRTALDDRIGTALTPYGLPRDYRWGTHYLRETRERLMALQCGAARRFTVMLAGDSFTQNKPYWSGAFTKALMAAYGDGGFGWCGFSATGDGVIGNSRPDVVQVTRTGTWADEKWIRPGPDLGSATSTAAGSRVTVTGPGTPTLSGADLYAYGTADGQARYRWNGGPWTTIALTGSGLTIASIATGIPTLGAFTLDVEVVSGTVSLSGVNLKSSAPGVVVHNVACSGSRLSHHVAVDAAQYQAGIAGLAPDLVVPLLGTNDQANSTPTAFAAQYATLIGRLRVARPTADILMVMPPENLRTYIDDPMVNYAAAAYPVAQQQRCAWIDLQLVFGDQASDYGSTSGRPWIGSDNLHPQPGYFPISSAVYRTLAYS